VDGIFESLIIVLEAFFDGVFWRAIGEDGVAAAVLGNWSIQELGVASVQINRGCIGPFGEYLRFESCETRFDIGENIFGALHPVI
jgi:hypothetical protein